jgi:P27 family predicted phage terminase small subunit
MARPTKPNHIKKAAGTLRKDRMIEKCIKHDLIRSIPEITSLAITDGKILNKDGKGYFNFICSKMIQEGILSDVYIVDIHNAAFWHQTITDAQRHLKKEGYVTKFPTGSVQISAFVSIIEKANKALNEFSNRYGLNLAASQKIQIPDNDNDEFD